MLPENSRTNFWLDTIRLEKYNLTIYNYDATGLDGAQFRFLVEDSSLQVFALKTSYRGAPLTDYYPRKKAFERICDSIPIFEPLEYDYQGLENYFNESIYFTKNPLDLGLLDTIIKLDTYFHHDGFAIKDTVKIFQLINSFTNILDTDSIKSELKRVIRIYLTKKNARMYLCQTEYPYKILYIDFDPFYSGDIQFTKPDGSKAKNEPDFSKPYHSSVLNHPINMRFIRFNLKGE